ncbi:GNAT family N-acetyltransferase [Clostridium cellulovorans]|uniref:N-acetyltransferase domain-containing protein n=1 Tax=Clostridium cellulovorans (strain ATCC 35296 / DSM 3052 / OCM 3 / 743B) TaxID=573061 RepID=D9SS23_CLOC7|nr:GNAT family N-acetyltransferase [Clostridium cellulovorans]ADL52470.1 hypothetical protein Clocel_2773 [Clostridium cellulovorans 743B]
MLNVSIEDNLFIIKSIKEEDLKHIEAWLIDQREVINTKELYERFLEYYLSEGEFFFKIQEQDNIIGIFRGRIEFYEYNKAWLSFFIFDKNSDKGYILDSIIDYFRKNYSVREIETGVISSNIKGIKFLKSHGFEVARISRGYFKDNGEENDMMIMRRIV